MQPDRVIGSLTEALAAGEVHLWIIDVRDGPLGERDANAMAKVLAADERARAGRFASDLHRLRFVRARYALRALAARYLGRRPEQLRFVVGPWGKPELPGERLQFNLSRSGDFAVSAFTLDAPVGVDIERALDSLDDAGVADLARIVCAPAERAALDALMGDARRAAFYRLWTRKEAFLKAIGRGLSREPREIAVGFDDGDGFVAGSEDHPDGWTLASYATPPGYVGACAVRRRATANRLFEFDAGWLEAPWHAG